MGRSLLRCLGVLACAAAVWAEPITFTVSPGGDNLIRFESKAPLETVAGTTRQVSGTVKLDPANLSAGVSADLRVEAATIKTGNGTRDGHMRNNHLHTDQYPDILFVLENAAFDGALESGQTREFKVPGKFTLHGVTHDIEAPTKVTLDESGGKRLHIVSNFQVKLADYEIPRPQFLIILQADMAGRAIVIGLGMGLLAALAPARAVAGLAPAEVFRR